MVLAKWPWSLAQPSSSARGVVFLLEMQPTLILPSPQGFGDPAGEHWLGNEVVHQLTSRAAYSLRVELQDWEGNEAYAQYDHFQLGSEGQLYRWARGQGRRVG